MLQKIINAVEPFGFTLVTIAGANLAGWIRFSNTYTVGIVVVGFGILFILNHVVKQVTTNAVNKTK